MITVGGFALIMFLIRIFAFKLYESPKYLMGKGRDAEAVAVVHEVARQNGRVSTLTLAHLQALELGGEKQAIDARAVLMRQLTKFNASHLRALFATPVLVRSTLLITTIWAFIGLGFPLYNAFIPFIQAQRGIDFGDGSRSLPYRNSLIIAAVGVPGALIGGLAVQSARLGRRGTLGIATALTGACLFASTTATDSNALLGWNCAFNLLSNIMYAVLYSYTPEIFLTKDRGTGNALTASANRIFGVMAPIGRAFIFYFNFMTVDVIDSALFSTNSRDVCRFAYRGTGICERRLADRSRTADAWPAFRASGAHKLMNFICKEQRVEEELYVEC